MLGLGIPCEAALNQMFSVGYKSLTIFDSNLKKIYPLVDLKEDSGVQNLLEMKTAGTNLGFRVSRHSIIIDLLHCSGSLCFSILREFVVRNSSLFAFEAPIA